MHEEFIRKVIEPYRSNVLHRDLVEAALRLCEETLDTGFVHRDGGECGWDFFVCPTCGDEATITFNLTGSVENVEEMEHREGCAFAAYEAAKEDARL